MDFGFNINPSSTIDLNKVDTALYDRICAEVPAAKTCINCGSCSATCTAGPYSGMSVRKLILGLQRGTDISAMVKGCMLCGKCTMVCPRGINTRQLILSVCKLYGK